MKPLNYQLFEHLKLQLGRVRISKDGVDANIDYLPDYAFREGRLSAHVNEWGETYNVNCPFCCDTRGRLAISHRWAVRDQKTGDDMLHLAICFNEQCLATRERQTQLHALVYPNGNWAILVDPPEFSRRKMKPQAPPREIVLPSAIPLDELSASHPAVLYVKERGYDPVSLAKQRGVTYCDTSTSSHPPIAKRLIIPIRQPGILPDTIGKTVLVGWQARTIIEEEPKYLTSTGTRKNQLLYGLHHAVKTTGPVVVAEGTTDVWRIGPNAVALIGKTISSVQCSLVARHFRGRPVVVMLDRDAVLEAEKVRADIVHSRILSGDNSPVIIASTPAGRKDPGECTAGEIKAGIAAALR